MTENLLSKQCVVILVNNQTLKKLHYGFQDLRNSIIFPTLTYRNETWKWNEAQQSKLYSDGNGNDIFENCM